MNNDLKDKFNCVQHRSDFNSYTECLISFAENPQNIKMFTTDKKLTKKTKN